MSVTIRRAAKTDMRTVAELAIKLFAQHRAYDARRFAEIASVKGAEKFYAGRIESKDAAVLIAEMENRIVGFAYVQYERLDYSNLLENAVWLHDIYISETARGKDAGRLLIAESVKVAAEELGANKLMLSAASQNESARRFFERSGFRTTMVEMMLDLT